MHTERRQALTLPDIVINIHMPVTSVSNAQHASIRTFVSLQVLTDRADYNQTILDSYYNNNPSA